MSSAQKDAAAAGVSVRESLQHAWASFLGLVGAVYTDQELALNLFGLVGVYLLIKMQVEATDEAEAKKKQLSD
ncbi:hypothetical protein E2562_019133 [Oryza meyeriana var. granulata]|uniref:Uncharacterized protein n=1 Tax=Oryza meyeriana var. granulata TaxID=110450 RepID=A0A6G1CRN8_9ORYZ|nr:hypothetical protein E2562_019133 [Oryza meyeriana var. granulata]